MEYKYEACAKMYKNTSFSLDFGFPHGYMLQNQTKMSSFYAWNACRQNKLKRSKNNTEDEKLGKIQRFSIREP